MFNGHRSTCVAILTLQFDCVVDWADCARLLHEQKMRLASHQDELREQLTFVLNRHFFSRRTPSAFLLCIAYQHS